MDSMCAPRVTRQMSRRYSHSRQTLSSMSCVTFPIAVAVIEPFQMLRPLCVIDTNDISYSSYGVTKSSDNLYAPSITNCLWIYVLRRCFRCVVFCMPPGELHISDLKSILSWVYSFIRVSVFWMLIFSLTKSRASTTHFMKPEGSLPQ
jgi:hypothetical protein